METAPYYKTYLLGALQRAQMNEVQTDTILSKFDKLANAGGALVAFRCLHESYANEDTETACATVKAAIQKALEKLKDHAGPERDVLRRLRAAVERANNNLSKCSALVDGLPALSEKELEAIKLKLPKFMEQERQTALASVRNLKEQLTKLEVSVIVSGKAKGRLVNPYNGYAIDENGNRYEMACFVAD